MICLRYRKHTKKNDDTSLFWLKCYTENPKTLRSGTWVLNYYEIYVNCPSWFLYNNLDVLKHSWLQDQDQTFREKYTFMFLDCLLLNAPSAFKYKLESLRFGGNWEGQKIDLRQFMSDASLKKFTSFLLEETILKDKNDILLQYLIGKEEYSHFKAKQGELNQLILTQKRIADKLKVWLDEENLVALQYSPIFEISILQREVLLKVVIPSFKDKLSINQNLGEFAYNMSKLANNLSGEMQVRVLLELANEIERIEGEKI